MGLEARYVLTPFAAMAQVRSEGTTPVDCISIPAGLIVWHVLVRIRVPCVYASPINYLVGDEDDADGYLLPANAKTGAGNVRGDQLSEPGVYLWNPDYGNFMKFNAVARKLKLELSAVPDTEGIYEVILIGHRTLLN